MTTYDTKRIYEDAKPGDGYRVLVDGLWPRGISKDKAALGEWCREIAPSNELRQWFAHDPAKYDEFKVKYLKELANNPEAAAALARWRSYTRVTLLYSAKDTAHNQAVVLLEYLHLHESDNLRVIP